MGGGPAGVTPRSARPSSAPAMPRPETPGGVMLAAALDSQGIALGRHWLVVDELRAGRLVAPFDTSVRDDFQ